MPPDLQLLHPERAAHATIRGFLYQTCLGVLRWLDLAPDEVLVCEGDEDLDRLIRGGGGISEQVKAYSGSLGLADRAVSDSLRNFFLAYVALRRRGENRRFRFITTARQKRQRGGGRLDVLREWQEGERGAELVGAVRTLLADFDPPAVGPVEKRGMEVEESLAWLDAEAEGWRGFLDAVEWSFDAPDLVRVRQEIRNRLSVRESAPDAVRPDLAMSLNNLSNRLRDLGRLEEALAAVEEAVEIRRELVASRPDAVRPDLAMSLNNLSNRLRDLGRSEEALAAIEEAVEIRRELAASRPDAFRPDLATSLNDLSLSLRRLGRSEEALAAIEEAVEIRHELAALRPDASRPNLAMSLSNLSLILRDLEQREEALTAIEVAVELFRELAASRPDAFRPNLATSLSNLSDCLSGLDRREEALAAIEETVVIRRELVASRPDVFPAALARSLNNLSLRLRDLDRREEALTSAMEAVEIVAPSFIAQPHAFRELMGTLIGTYRELLEQAGREPDPDLDPVLRMFAND
jgi:tetratricopeptide (TPR) repeat protein